MGGDIEIDWVYEILSTQDPNEWTGGEIEVLSDT